MRSRLLGFPWVFSNIFSRTSSSLHFRPSSCDLTVRRISSQHHRTRTKLSQLYLHTYYSMAPLANSSRMALFPLVHYPRDRGKEFSLKSARSVVSFQDREFVEMEVPYNGAPKRPGSPSPLTSPAHSTASRGGLLHSCCGRCYPQRYQVRGRRILASTTSISEGAPSSSSHSHQSQPGRSHYQQTPTVDPATVPNVVFNVPGDADRQRRQGASSSSPYNETRV